VTLDVEEAQLVLRARCGDREALEALLGRIQRPLWRYVSSLVGAQDADDVAQDTMVMVCRKIGWLEDPERFRAWMFRIASRLAFRRLRQRRRWFERAADEDLAGAVEAVEEPSAADAGRLAGELLADASLSPRSRAVLVLHFGEGMQLAAVAAILEIPLGTVKSRLAYGLKALRKQMADRENR
jgi:RNA polymerase sigma-70 factor, ECF subfamily